MSAERELLYNLTIRQITTDTDAVRIGEMSATEAAAALEAQGLNAADLVSKVRNMSDAMRRNAEIASRMHTDRHDVRRRAMLLSLMALVGLVVMCGAFVAATGYPEMKEAARKLVTLVLVGGFALFIVSLLATLYVVWNAFVHKAILAEVASEETLELITAIEGVRVAQPNATISQLTVLLRQNPIWTKYDPLQHA